jgi:hypothetical protein
MIRNNRGISDREAEQDEIGRQPERIIIALLRPVTNSTSDEATPFGGK